MKQKHKKYIYIYKVKSWFWRKISNFINHLATLTKRNKEKTKLIRLDMQKDTLQNMPMSTEDHRFQKLIPINWKF